MPCRSAGRYTGELKFQKMRALSNIKYAMINQKSACAIALISFTCYSNVPIGIGHLDEIATYIYRVRVDSIQNEKVYLKIVEPIRGRSTLKNVYVNLNELMGDSAIQKRNYIIALDSVGNPFNVNFGKEIQYGCGNYNFAEIKSEQIKAYLYKADLRKKRVTIRSLKSDILKKKK
jgi:hypothetical protein